MTNIRPGLSHTLQQTYTSTNSSSSRKH